MVSQNGEYAVPGLQAAECMGVVFQLVRGHGDEVAGECNHVRFKLVYLVHGPLQMLLAAVE